MSSSKKLVLFGTNRHAICIDDYSMFFRRTNHRISHIFYPIGSHRNRDWWERGEREDRARDSVVDPMTWYRGDVTVWAELERDVFPVLDRLEFDYICLGNGTDPAHEALVARYGRDKILFTEYGWLPWSRHFYISRGGTGFNSEIAKVDGDHLDRLAINHAEIEEFRRTLDTGHDVTYDDFIYMPLQKDVNDFKFLFNRFNNNEEYLRFVDGIVPPEITILVKSHPLYRKQYDLSFSNRMVDITNADLNKDQLYRRMRAMVCLNSTSILEALAYSGRVFSYGDDLFVGKGVTHHKVEDAQAFAEALDAPIDRDRPLKFVSLLMSRQIDRHRCVADDSLYIARHYWNVCL